MSIFVQDIKISLKKLVTTRIEFRNWNCFTGMMKSNSCTYNSNKLPNLLKGSNKSFCVLIKYKKIIPEQTMCNKSISTSTF